MNPSENDTAMHVSWALNLKSETLTDGNFSGEPILWSVYEL